MRQPRWMEFLKDYEFTLHYHPNKENVLADHSVGSRLEY